MNHTLRGSTALSRKYAVWVLQEFPFTRLPKRMVVKLVYTMVFWFNYKIPDNYISNTLGTGSIILGRTYGYNKICGDGSKFGEYVQTHEETTNTMKAKTVSVIYLRPTGNMKGSFYYYRLWSGCQLHRRQRTPLPMSQEMIYRFHYIAPMQKAPTGLAFTRPDGTPVNASDDDE